MTLCDMMIFYSIFGDYMKRMLIVVFLAIIFGGICSFCIFRTLVKADNAYDEFIAFQIGVYENYDNAIKVADRNNGIVVEDGFFRVYVTVLKSEESVLKMEDYFNNIGLNYFKKEILIDKSFGDDIFTYEDMILKSSTDTYNTINKEILKVYKEYN